MAFSYNFFSTSKLSWAADNVFEVCM